MSQEIAADPGSEGLRNPKVSVVIAAYNAERTISQTIESVLRQTYQALEIVICDDASIDDTAAIVARYRDDRITLIRNGSNLGPGPSRDAAIAVASGEWIAFMDADDTCHPTRIERMLWATKEEPDVIVFDNSVECHDTASGMRPWRLMRPARAFGRVGSMGFLDLSVRAWLLSKRMLIKPLFPVSVVHAHGVRHSDIRFAEDSEFVLRILACGLRLRFLPEPLYFYRITPGSLTASRERWGVAAAMLRRMVPRFQSDPATVEALVLAAKRAEDLQAYQDFTSQIKQGHLVRGVRMAARQPSIIGELGRRLLRDVVYQTQRMIARGSKR